MTTIMPKGEKLRQAVRWISDERTEEGQRSMSELIQAASLRFNLSPKEEQYLYSFFDNTK